MYAHKLQFYLSKCVEPAITYLSVLNSNKVQYSLHFDILSAYNIVDNNKILLLHILNFLMWNNLQI